MTLGLKYEENNDIDLLTTTYVHRLACALLKFCKNFVTKFVLFQTPRIRALEHTGSILLITRLSPGQVTTSQSLCSRSLLTGCN